MKNKYHNVAVVILAGGKSERAETTKGLRIVQKQFWIDILIQHFKDLGTDNIFVGLGFSNQEYLNKSILLQSIKHFINPYPEHGSFSTLQNVLRQTLKFDWKHIIIMHIDHAKPSPITLKKLIDMKGFDVSKPVFKKQSGHPIVLSHAFCKTLLSKSHSSKLNIAIKELSIKKIQWTDVGDSTIHENMNSEQQWIRYSTK